jgi:hypothetical protein
MNAEQWNALYPVGTLVFAYPGFRPEDDRNARRLVTRTRTNAQMSASGDPVVWVDGEGSYICLTHVDPVSESVWQDARKSDVCGAREPEPRTGTSPCVLPAGHGGLKHQDKWTNQWPALPVPVGDQPQPLDDTPLAEIAARANAASKGPWKVCEDYSDVLDGNGHQIISHFYDADGKFIAHARQDVPALLAEVERLKEALSEAADQVAELESNLGGSTARVAELEAERRTTTDALDAHRLTVLDEALDALRKWSDPNPKLQPGLNFAIGALLAVRDRQPATNTAEEAAS